MKKMQNPTKYINEYCLGFSLAQLQYHIEQGNIKERPDPDPKHDLWIYCYTPKVQYDRIWDVCTTTCRGLILNSEGEIIGRPFKKFFNYDEEIGFQIYGAPPNLNPIITDKMDGSLGILCTYKNDLIFASKGSFESDVANWFAAHFLSAHKDKVEQIKNHIHRTFLFEVITPGNRVVLDYYNNAHIKFLSSINNIDTNEKKDFSFLEKILVNHNVFDFTSIKDFGDKIKQDQNRIEGYVLSWPNFSKISFQELTYRVKVKTQWYLDLHRLVFGLTPKKVWSVLRESGTIEPMLAQMPDEFCGEIRSISKNLNKQFTEIESEVKSIFYSRNYHLNNLGTTWRKEFALDMQANVDKKFHSLIWNLIDGKVENFKDNIWKMIEPKATKKDDE